MEYRTLGKTGLRVPAIGFGGAPLGLANYLSPWDPAETSQREGAIRAIVRALELGITYFDSALAYGQGASERLIGEGRRRAGALAAGMIVATKTPGAQRTYEAVLHSAETSLANLGLERVDVLQFHGSVWRDDAVDAVLAGGLAAYGELRRRGKVRFLGFTSETCSPGTYRLLRSGAFDLIQIAYNVLYQDACNLMVRSGPILEAKERGMGVVTMRSLSSGVFQKLLGSWTKGSMGGGAPIDGYAAALQFVLSNPYVDCALVGMRTVAEVEGNRRVVDDRAGRLDLEALHRRYV